MNGRSLRRVASGIRSALSPAPPAARESNQDKLLAALLGSSSALLDSFIWKTNQAPRPGSPALFQFGCGTNPLPNFTNIDFIRDADNVFVWDLLNRWPESLRGTAEGAFSEELMEHFFYGEQLSILCNINRLLRPGAIYRVLMPNLQRLINIYGEYKPAPDRYFFQQYGWLTGADVLNCGLRFSGHKWLHNQQSFITQASQCGFEVIPTPCNESRDERLEGINLRDEKSSLSFAFDLIKRNEVELTLVSPASVQGARQVGELGECPLWQTTADLALVRYELPSPIAANSIATLLVRISNLSVAREHSIHAITLNGDQATRHLIDETLKSKKFFNSMSFCEIRRFPALPELIRSVEVVVGLRPGEQVLCGDLELYACDAQTPE